MPRSIQLRLLDIHRAAEKIKQMIETREAFLSNVVVQDAVAYNVMAIGEACSHLPETLKQEIPEIPWNAIRGLRNLLTHEYFIIDPNILYTTATTNITELIQALERWQKRNNGLD